MTLRRIVLCAFTLCLLAGSLAARDNKLMHCFVFTAEAGASDADWQAFFKATDELPGKIPGLSAVWYGKLRRPFTVFAPDEATRKQIKPDSTDVSGKFGRVTRQWGACMEFAGEDALKTYANHPAHKEWEKVYFKVRQYGTNTFDILPTK